MIKVDIEKKLKQIHSVLAGYKGDIVNDNEKKQCRLVRKIGAKMFYLIVVGYKDAMASFKTSHLVVLSEHSGISRR